MSVSDAQKPILNFTLITRHNFMACDLELHAISIKRCFGVVSALRQFLLTALVFLISFSAQHNYPYKNSFLYLHIQFLLILQDYVIINVAVELKMVHKLQRFNSSFPFPNGYPGFSVLSTGVNRIKAITNSSRIKVITNPSSFVPENGTVLVFYISSQ